MPTIRPLPRSLDRSQASPCPASSCGWPTGSTWPPAASRS